MLKRIVFLVVLFFISCNNLWAEGMDYYNESIYKKYELQFKQNDSIISGKSYDEKEEIILKAYDFINNIDNIQLSDSKKKKYVNMFLALYYHLKDNTDNDFFDIDSDIKIYVISSQECIWCGSTSQILKDEQDELTTEYPFLDIKSKAFIYEENEKIQKLVKSLDISSFPLLLVKTTQQLSHERYTPLGENLYSLDGIQYYNTDTSYLPVQKISKTQKTELISLARLREIGVPKILWVQFSDLDCEACKILYLSGIEEELYNLYGEQFGKIFFHFPLTYHEEARQKAELIECIGQKEGNSAYYEYITKNYQSSSLTGLGLLNIAGENGFNKDELNKCVINKEYSSRIDRQIKIGKDLGLISTPHNLFLNTQTDEYIVVPYDMIGSNNFQKVIERLLY